MSSRRRADPAESVTMASERRICGMAKDCGMNGMRGALRMQQARVDVGPSRGYNRKGEAQGKICRGLRSLRRGFLVGVTVYMPL